MARKIFFCIFVVSLIVMFYAYAGEVKLTTYYPAPYGEYKKVVTKTLGVGTTTAPDPATNTGDAWIGGNLRLGPTTSASTGVLTNGTYPLLHTYHNSAVDGNNMFIGGAGNFTMGPATGQTENYRGSYNNAIGNLALASNTTGYSNNTLGYWALCSNTTGSNNDAIGNYALGYNTTGNYNDAMGLAALFHNLTGTCNVAVGVNAGCQNTTGNYNTALGAGALAYNTTGIANVAVGTSSLVSLTSGSNNTVVGELSGYGITTGSNNTIIGANVTGLASDLSNNIIIADGDGNRRINVNSSGLVGIGTTSPNVELHVKSSTSNADIATESSDGYKWTMSTEVGGKWILNRNIPGDLPAIVATQNGNVGIGTTSPAAKLDVSGDGSAIIVPRKSTTGDPAGVNGMIYYNSPAKKFRGYENGAWKDIKTN